MNANMQEYVSSNYMAISADGSDRTFRRVPADDGTAVIIIPSPASHGMREAESFRRICAHLYERGVPVPQLLDFDPATGIITVEDLGNIHLQRQVCRLAEAGCMERIELLYRQAIEILVHMQTSGIQGFDTEWCHDTCCYDADMACNREGLYFLGEFAENFMKIPRTREVEEEIRQISGIVPSLTTDLLLHRDFQSRNIMIKDGRLRIIDFQGTRVGPAGYDAASLIFDPYVPLPMELRRKLAGYFCKRFISSWQHEGKTEQDMQEEVHLLGILRLMQALGAYAFLTLKRNRTFFIQYMHPALDILDSLLQQWEKSDMPAHALKNLVKILGNNLALHIKVSEAASCPEK
jgi:aminoglycoside/choline kinase family phosphotransferase